MANVHKHTKIHTLLLASPHAPLVPYIWFIHRHRTSRDRSKRWGRLHAVYSNDYSYCHHPRCPIQLTLQLSSRHDGVARETRIRNVDGMFLYFVTVQHGIDMFSCPRCCLDANLCSLVSSRSSTVPHTHYTLRTRLADLFDMDPCATWRTIRGDQPFSFLSIANSCFTSQ